MLYWNNQKVVENNSKNHHKIFKKIYNTKFMKTALTEVYLLVHPFYNKTGDYWRNVCKNFLKLWQESITDASQRENSYGVLLNSSAPNTPKDFVKELTRYFRKSFPWSRRSILQDLDGTALRLIKPFVFWDTTQVKKVSARGIYVNQCVPRALTDLIDLLSVSKEKAHIDFYESDTGFMPEGFTETKYLHKGHAKLVLPSSRPSLEENLHYTQKLLTPQ